MRSLLAMIAFAACACPRAAPAPSPVPVEVDAMPTPVTRPATPPAPATNDCQHGLLALAAGELTVWNGADGCTRADVDHVFGGTGRADSWGSFGPEQSYKVGQRYVKVSYKGRGRPCPVAAAESRKRLAGSETRRPCGRDTRPCGGDEMRFLLLVCLIGCAKEQATPEAQPPPGPAAAGPVAREIIAGTPTYWPEAKLWVAIAERPDHVQVVAGPTQRELRDVTGARMDERYIEIDDVFALTPSADGMVVARDTHGLGDGTRAVMLLVLDGSQPKVARRWTGLTGEVAPMERGLPPSRAAAVAPEVASPPPAQLVLDLVERHPGEAQLVTYQQAIAVDVAGGAFTLPYDADEATLTLSPAGEKIVARLSTAANVAKNCEALLVASDPSTRTGLRVVDRWRGDCTSAAPFEPAE